MTTPGIGFGPDKGPDVEQGGGGGAPAEHIHAEYADSVHEHPEYLTEAPAGVQFAYDYVVVT